MQNHLQFMDVPKVIATCLSHFGTHLLTDLENLLAFDDEVRKYAQKIVSNF